MLRILINLLLSYMHALRNQFFINLFAFLCNLLLIAFLHNKNIVFDIYLLKIQIACFLLIYILL